MGQSSLSLQWSWGVCAAPAVASPPFAVTCSVTFGLRDKKSQEKISSKFLVVFTWQSSRHTESAEQSKNSLAVKDLEKQVVLCESNIAQKGKGIYANILS